MPHTLGVFTPTPAQKKLLNDRMAEHIAAGKTPDEAYALVAAWLRGLADYVSRWERIHARMAAGVTRKEAIAAEEAS